MHLLIYFVLLALDLFQLNTDPKSRTTFLIPIVKGENMGKLNFKVRWSFCLGDGPFRKYKDVTDLEKFEQDTKEWMPDCKCSSCKFSC